MTARSKACVTAVIRFSASSTTPRPPPARTTVATCSKSFSVSWLSLASSHRTPSHALVESRAALDHVGQDSYTTEVLATAALQQYPRRPSFSDVHTPGLSPL